MMRFLFVVTLALLLNLGVVYGKAKSCKGHTGGLPPCSGGTDEIWFNFDVELKKNIDDCDETDRFVMGALISEIVEEIECEVPNYKQELFDGELCEYPEAVEHPPGQNRQLVVDESHRRLGRTYRYSGGGRFRRCRSTTDRFLKEYVSVDLVCKLADAAELGMTLSESAMEEATNEFEEIVDLAATFYDQKKANDHMEKAKKELDKCKEKEVKAVAEAKVTREWCKQAERKPSDKKRLEECFKGAEKTYKNAMKETKETRKAFMKVEGMKFKMMKEQSKYESEQEKDKGMDRIEKVKDEMDDQVKALEEQIKLKKKQKGKEKDKNKKTILEAEIKTMENEKKKMKDKNKHTNELLKKKTEIEAKIARLRTDVQIADDDDSLLDDFAKLLEEEIPYRLMKYYNVSTGGCLGDNENLYPEAKVNCWSTGQEQSRVPLEECKLNFDHRQLLSERLDFLSG